ncbi:C4-dicarboxylate ABC transporter substrate-binding protein [Aureimonas sp. SA4125]|uniref:TRAP transporter substrate-binding protein n=1 Tax=Aureimonas sp. SA4125 TaxID=2826993 RepID=UPI001CC70832|nr:TRAP transporter substrate-binding protein [Aureimonas sp. SA4125]BDA85738.1 C4-dicarboxylate ABC transporter substrate-binding protein [Aureimonas sp. SA4125]
MTLRYLSGTAAALLLGVSIGVAGWAAPAVAQTKLVGASQFDENHAFTKTMRKFEELVSACYTEEPIVFEMHLNSELGLEKDYVAYMNQGLSVDYAVASPAHMSTFSKMAPLMDMPFLFRDEDHWKKVLEADALKPIADDILAKADIRLLGYAGGGTRNIFATRPVTNMEEMKGLSIRMQGAPIWTSVFGALGAAPTVIAYNEVYNAIQTGVIEAAENEAAGVEQMKFFEVGPELSLTKHAITIRPLMMSNKIYQGLPEALQKCIDEAGPKAGQHGRDIESSEDGKKVDAMVEKGWIKTHEFTDRDAMLSAASPVLEAYAEELGAAEVLKNIQAIR